MINGTNRYINIYGNSYGRLRAYPIFNDIYGGYWFYYTSYYADYNGDGDYYGEDEYVGYSTNWGPGRVEDNGWILEV